MRMISQLTTKFLVSVVRFYQLYLSPYKGFKCAHAKYTHNLSCSNYGLKVLKENSPRDAIKLIRHRLKACSHINHLYQKPFTRSTSKKGFLSKNQKQTGFVDGCDAVPDCSGCDAPDCSALECSFFENCALGSACDVSWETCYIAESCSSCDIWGWSKSSVNNNISQSDIDPSLPIEPVEQIIPNFQLLSPLSDGFILYQHNNGDYYSIHESMVRSSENDILNGLTSIPSVKLSENEVKDILAKK